MERNMNGNVLNYQPDYDLCILNYGTSTHTSSCMYVCIMSKKICSSVARIRLGGAGGGAPLVLVQETTRLLL